MKEQRTLCHSCVQDYEEAGYEIKRDYTEQYKGECDICRRMGWTYLIEREPDKKTLNRLIGGKT